MYNFLEISGTMNLLDQTLFGWIAPGFQANPPLIVIARLIATYAVGAVPITLSAIWILRPDKRNNVLTAILAGVIGILAAEALSTWIGRPRPFMIGLSPLYLPHAAEGSFPSAHAAVMLAVGFTLLRSEGIRFAGWVLMLVGLLTGWARVYTGLHFPLDIAGSAVLSAGIAWMLGADGPHWVAAQVKRADQCRVVISGRRHSEVRAAGQPPNPK